MIHSEIVQFLSEIDTNIFLSFNGIHSPFWDYFMSSFTGKIIWVPMYATILYILLRNFHWKVVVCYVNPEKPDVPLNKNDAFQKVQKRRVQEKR